MTEPLRSGVETDDLDDLEFGARVWSTTHQDHRGYVGGVIIDIDRVAETVTVLPDFGPHQGPSPKTIPIPEVNVEGLSDPATWNTRAAGVAAHQILAWLTRLTRKVDRERNDAAKWTGVAMMLQALHDSGMYLPGAEKRYRQSRR